MFNEPHQRKNIRLPGKDYTEDGVYYITICTFDGHEFFGTIKDNKMELSKFGLVIVSEWLKLPTVFPQIKLDDYVIMPNHLHCILVVTNLSNERIILGNIVRNFKSKVTNLLRKENNDRELKLWHRNYYEHCIGGTDDLTRVRNYIRNNVKNWIYDEYHPKRRQRE